VFLQIRPAMLSLLQERLFLRVGPSYLFASSTVSFQKKVF
jgi:hypothetical protein